MAETLDSALVKAYEFIEANRIDEARTLLTPLLEQYPDDADLWWVYSHAVDNREDAQAALRRVVELDPNFSEAERLLQEAEEGVTEPDSGEPGIRSIKPLAPMPATETSSDVDDVPDFDDYLEDEEEDNDELEFVSEVDSGPNWMLIGAIAVGLIVVFLLILALSPDDVDDATPTQLAIAPTETTFSVPANSALVTDTAEPEIEDTEEVEAVDVTEDVTDEAISPTDVGDVTTDEPSATETGEVTDEPVETEEATDTETPSETPTTAATETPEPTVGELVVAGLSEDFDLSDNTPSVTETALGETLTLEFCLSDNTRNVLINDALGALAAAPIENGEFEAVAATLYNCETDEAIRTIGVSVEDAVRFREGEIDERDFQLEWVVLG